MNKIELTNEQQKKLDQVQRTVTDPVVKKTLLEYFEHADLPEKISDQILFSVIQLIQEVVGVAFIRLKYLSTKYVTSEKIAGATVRTPGSIPLYRHGKEAVDYISCHEPFNGSLVSVSTAGTPPGQVYLRHGPLTLTGAQGFVPKPELLSVEYLFLYLKTNESYFGSKSSGTILRQIQPVYLQNFKIPVLPKYKQQEIVDLLMPMIQTQEELNNSSEQAELQKKVLLNVVFRGLDSNTDCCREGVELFNKLSTVAELKKLCAELSIDTSILGEAELSTLVNALVDYRDNESLCTFDKLANQIAQITPEQLAKKQPGEELTPVFSLFCKITQRVKGCVELPLILAGRNVRMKPLRRNQTTPGTEVAHWQNAMQPTAFISYKHPHKGATVIISKSGANAGTVNFWNGPKLTHDNITIEQREDISNCKFLYFATKLVQPRFTSLARGTGIPNVNPTLIRNTRIKLPALEVQNRIVDDLYPLNEYSKLLEEQRNRLAQLFAYNLKKSFEPFIATARKLTSSANL